MAVAVTEAANAQTASAVDACHVLFGLCFSNKIDLGLFLTLGLFLAGIFVNSHFDRSKRDRDRKDEEEKRTKTRQRFLVALSEEIGLNVDSLQKYADLFPSRGSLEAFFAKSEMARPLITVSYFSVIFRSQSDVLQDLPVRLVRNIVEFYGKLEEMSVDCTAINGPAFITISKEGKLAMLADIETQQRIMLKQGKTIKDAISQHLIDTGAIPNR